jgi:ankyrin repeat protein
MFLFSAIFLCIGLCHNHLVASELRPECDMDNSESPCGQIRKAMENGSFSEFVALANRIDVAECRTQDGVNLLHRASTYGLNLAMDVLIKLKRMDVNKADDHGWTPLHYAVSLGSGIATRKLLEAGANPLLEDSEGKRPRQHMENVCEDYLEAIQKVVNDGKASEESYYKTLSGYQEIRSVLRQYERIQRFKNHRIRAEQ